MPPRTTRKSYRPRVSDRTMVGTSPPPRLLASEAESIVTITMELQKEKARASQHYVGWRARRRPCSFQSQRQCFLLTLPFIERRYRTSGFSSFRLARLIGSWCLMPATTLRGVDECYRLIAT